MPGRHRLFLPSAVLVRWNPRTLFRRSPLPEINDGVA